MCRHRLCSRPDQIPRSRSMSAPRFPSMGWKKKVLMEGSKQELRKMRVTEVS
jgi:hypothetical protein